MSASAQVATPPPTSSGDRTGTLRRVACVVGMLVGPWGFVVVNTAYALAIRDGGSDETGADALALFAAHPELVRFPVTAGMVGCILVIPAVLGIFRLAPASRLVVVGGSMMIAGYVCYFDVLGSAFRTLAMAEHLGRHGAVAADFAAVIDASEGGEPWSVWIFAVFVLGNLVGTTLLSVGLLRARAVPRWAALGILSWPPLHVIGLAFFGNEVPQVIGAVLQAAGFAGCTVVLLRRRL
jgi:hypothetical protein